jgi:hypothetical protein
MQPGTLPLLSSRSLLRGDVASGGPQWLPAALVFGSIGVVAYADFIVTSISLGYLYILPLGIGAMFLRSQISYGLIAVCVFLHDVFGPLIQARKHGLHTISRRSSGSPLSST